VQIESTILCGVCQYTQYYAGRGPGLHRGGEGARADGRPRRGGWGRPWVEVGWIAGSHADFGAVGG
jgi:hypothetical protein